MKLVSLLRSLRSMLPGKSPLVLDEPVHFHAIGIVRNRVRQPRTQGWEDIRSDIILRDDLAEALEGIEGFSHVIVVFQLDRIPEGERRLTLPVGKDGVERGVLATRSQRRPNPLGVSVVPVLHRRKGVLRVRGLDAMDGTPVLDIKPYLPLYDSVPDAKLPAWATSGER
jgi:tRNA-Thr(GGU) m(6)t(6)A37 methyltransferase TsaA